MITLTRKDNNTRLELPDLLRWTDEHDWSPLAQASPQYSLGGAVIVQQGSKLAGRPVTLGGEDDHNWLRRETLATLHDWAAVPELELTLDYHGRTLNVIFRNHEQALAATPVWWTNDEDSDCYRAEIRLMTL